MAEEIKPVEDEEEGLAEEVDSEEVTDVDADDRDDEFEYDADGNIIIPDIAEDEEEVDETEADEETEEADDNADDAKADETAEDKPDEKDARIKELEKQLAALEKQGKETLKKLGVNADDVLKGLEEVAAETDEVPIEEYRKKKAEAEKSEEAKRTSFETVMKSDLEEVQKFYPETKNLKSIAEIANFKAYGAMRDKGLSPKQAYIAVNPDSVQQTVAASVKQKSLNDTKTHLKSAVPKASKDTSVAMPESTLREWKDLFPKMSKKELVELYKQTLN